MPRIDSDTLMRAGMGFAQREFYLEAARAFARCTSDFPAFFEAHYNLALAYLALQRHEEALAALEKAPQTSSRQRSARSYMKGKILLATDRVDEAEQELSAAFVANPREENYALDLGLLRVKKRNQAGAIDVLSQGRQPSPPVRLPTARSLAGTASRWTTVSVPSVFAKIGEAGSNVWAGSVATGLHPVPRWAI
ncbi:MAG: tetratricopeptide repeat protein [Acidobacteria bacterium]|nr:tetratricopeptide repeat protein [Acidobacteriota bacterium]